MSRMTLLAEFELPIPPSVNNYTERTRSGGVMLTERAREYKNEVRQLLARKIPHKPSKARLAGEFIFYPANKRKFDLDNKMKLLQDSLEFAGLIENDEQFDELQIIRKRKEIVKGGKVAVMICEIEED